MFQQLLSGQGLVSLIRTYTPIWVGIALVSLQRWLDSHHILWVHVDSPQAAIYLTGAVISVYYFVARLLEKKWPSIGGFLLGKSGQPAYPATTSHVLPGLPSPTPVVPTPAIGATPPEVPNAPPGA